MQTFSSQYLSKSTKKTTNIETALSSLDGQAELVLGLLHRFGVTRLLQVVKFFVSVFVRD